MSLQLSRFARKLALVALPFVLYGLLIVAVDPYNFFGWSRLVDDADKREVQRIPPHQLRIGTSTIIRRSRDKNLCQDLIRGKDRFSRSFEKVFNQHRALSIFARQCY